MKKFAVLALVLAYSLVSLAFGSSVCDNAPCEPVINATVGEEFTITVSSNPSTGYEWWTKFDPKFLNLVDSGFSAGNASSGMVGVPGNEVFTFRAEAAGETEVYMLRLRPWVNETVIDSRIFPVVITE